MTFRKLVEMKQEEAVNGSYRDPTTLGLLKAAFWVTVAGVAYNVVAYYFFYSEEYRWDSKNLFVFASLFYGPPLVICLILMVFHYERQQIGLASVFIYSCVALPCAIMSVGYFVTIPVVLIRGRNMVPTVTSLGLVPMFAGYSIIITKFLIHRRRDISRRWF